MNGSGRRDAGHRSRNGDVRTGRVRQITRRIAAVAFLALVLSVLWVAPASAHAELASATPAPGASVPQAVAVLLRFSEALSPSLSTITVTGPAGDATRGPAAGMGEGARVVRRPVPLLRPGQYAVRWTSVSSD